MGSKIHLLQAECKCKDQKESEHFMVDDYNALVCLIVNIPGELQSHIANECKHHLAAVNNIVKYG